jgi:hypothetical protein
MTTTAEPEVQKLEGGERKPISELPLSPEARAALDAGLESARRGEIKPWGDFTKYASDDDE